MQKDKYTQFRDFGRNAIKNMLISAAKLKLHTNDTDAQMAVDPPA